MRVSIENRGDPDEKTLTMDLGNIQHPTSNTQHPKSAPTEAI
jgi:hypothetical protein